MYIPAYHPETVDPLAVDLHMHNCPLDIEIIPSNCGLGCDNCAFGRSAQKQGVKHVDELPEQVIRAFDLLQRRLIQEESGLQRVCLSHDPSYVGEGFQVSLDPDLYVGRFDLMSSNPSGLNIPDTIRSITQRHNWPSMGLLIPDKSLEIFQEPGRLREYFTPLILKTLEGSRLSLNLVGKSVDEKRFSEIFRSDNTYFEREQELRRVFRSLVQEYLGNEYYLSKAVTERGRNLVEFMDGMETEGLEDKNISLTGRYASELLARQGDFEDRRDLLQDLYNELFHTGIYGINFFPTHIMVNHKSKNINSPFFKITYAQFSELIEEPANDDQYFRDKLLLLIKKRIEDAATEKGLEIQKVRLKN